MTSRPSPWAQFMRRPRHTVSRALEMLFGGIFALPVFQMLPAFRLIRAQEPAIAPKIAVVAHVFYPELWPEIVTAWKALPAGTPLLVTTPHDKAATVRTLAARDASIEVFEVENRGRDIAPFLWLLNRGHLDAFDAVLKIHTKKSEHLRFGSLRRRVLFASLAGTEANLHRILRLLADGRTGLVGPAPYFRADPFYWMSNEVTVASLCRRMTPNAPARPGFFEGSMFWVRPASLAPLRALGLSTRDFEVEAGQLDGTLHHAVERVFALTALAGGYETRSTRGKLLLSPEAGQDLFITAVIAGVMPILRCLLRTDAARRLRPLLHPLYRKALRLPAINQLVRRQQIRRAIRPTAWYADYRHGVRYGDITWRGDIRLSVVMPVYKVRAEWLEEAVRSITGQTYPNWELVCVDDASGDPMLSGILQRAASADARVRVITLDHNEGVSRATNLGIGEASGDYILFMDHDDLLEPHALARFADAAYQDSPDILYADEVVTSASIEEIYQVMARPGFSHTFYLSHPFVVHPVAVRTTLVREIGGLDPSLRISQDVDFMLRALERARAVTHIPDILYRWRTHISSAGHKQQSAVMAITGGLKTEHLHRIGFPEAAVRDGPAFNTFRVSYFGKPSGRILAIIPTKNGVGLLRRCIDSVRATTKGLTLDILVVDHESDDPKTKQYLQQIVGQRNIRILPYAGSFNYSAINNYAVDACGSGYDYFLFLNNDIEAGHAGWLHAMLDLAMREDVGAVGATLLYPDGTVQHAGVVLGLCGAAEHAFKRVALRFGGTDDRASLYATRDYSAVTAACMLVASEVFRSVKGFDEDLQVGFGDTDLCLRIGQTGKRIINCADAILVHYESASRGQSLDGRDHHPHDSALFRERYGDILRDGDPYFSPLLADDDPTFVLKTTARLAPVVRYRTTTDILPKPRPIQRGGGSKG